VGFEQLKFPIEFSLLSGVFACLLLWGLATGRTLIKAPFRADRTTDPVMYWMVQTMYGLWFLLCLCVAVWMAPSHIYVRIVHGH
jgi:hypothetical protein